MKFLFFLILLIPSMCYPNDGAYFSNGSIIYPIQETNISLNKENLYFSFDGENTLVNVRFEFYNDNSTSKEILVGFQAPSAAGDIPDSLTQKPLIQDFIIQHDSRLLPYELKHTDCEDCDLKDLKENDFDNINSGVFVFLFKVNFKPGLNIINHSYKFKPSGNVSTDKIFNYILTTGAKWKSNTIKDFTLEIDLGQNKQFYITDIFNDNTTWSIIGTGKILNSNTGPNPNEKYKLIRLISGKIKINSKNFSPLKNLEFGIINKNCFSNYPIIITSDDQAFDTALRYLTIDSKHIGRELTKTELRILRNTFYAQYGYSFNTTDLAEYFKSKEWYIENPNLKLSDIELSSLERKFIETIITKEK